MKRCPQCDFIYEDDQSLCDMDGISLVFDARKLPNLNALDPNTTAVAPKRWRTRSGPVLAGLILATVLTLVYYVSIQQNLRGPESATGSTASKSAPKNPDQTSSPAAHQANAPVPASSANSSTDKPTSSVKEELPEEKEKVPATGKTDQPVSPVRTPKKQQSKPKQPAAKATGTAGGSANKKDSKIGSLLKKTGRFFKKAF